MAYSINNYSKEELIRELKKYKLFAKKSFTDNLAQTDDIQMASPIGGLINQQDLTIIWRIDF